MSLTHYSLPQRLSKLYSDTKNSSEAVIETKKTNVHPELSSLHRKYRIQKDRLLAWGLDWRDSDATSQDDIDESVARAGLTETVTSVLRTIKEILDEADRMNTLSIAGSGTTKERTYEQSFQSDTPVSFDQARYEDLAKDLTTSIDILYDLSRSRRTLRKTNSNSGRNTSKAQPSPFPDAYSASALTLVNPLPPNLSFRSGLPPKLDIAALTLPQEDPPPYDATEAPIPCRLIGQLKQSHSSTNPWKTSGSKTLETPVLVEYANFDSTYSATGVAPPLDRLEKLLALLVTLQEHGGLATFNCLGYFEDPKHSRYGLVYELPGFVYSGPSDQKSNVHPTPLSTILRGSSVSHRGQSALPPPLEERFRLAFRIVNAFKMFQDNEFEHRDIRSSNILLFQKKLPTGHVSGVGASRFDIRQPQICSFDLFSDYRIESKPETTSVDIYRHPSDPRAHGGVLSSSASHFDMYSLALVLLEIGLWLPLSDLFKTKYSLDDFKLRLGDLWIRKLASKCGSAYMQAARECFLVADRVIAGKQRSKEIPSVFNRIVTNLQKCCILDNDHDETGPNVRYPLPPQQTYTTRQKPVDQNIALSKDSFPENLVKRLSQERDSQLQESRRTSSTSKLVTSSSFSDPLPITRHNLQTSISLHDLSTAPTLRGDDPSLWELQRSEVRSPSRESLSDISSLYKESFTQAATTIQRAWRARSQNLSFRDYKRKVTIIQRQWRRKLAMRSATASNADSTNYQSESVQMDPAPEPEVETKGQFDMDIRLQEKTERPVLRVHPIQLPPSIVDEWHQALLPRLERLVSRTLRDSPETVSIDLLAIGGTSALAKPTMFVTCSSTSKVKAVLTRKFTYDKNIFDLKVRKGRIRRSKLANKSIKRHPSRSLANGQKTPSNPYYYERPLCGASIGAFDGNHHLPPVSFGGVVMVDDEPYGMTVHHLLDSPSEYESEDEDDSVLDDITRSSAPLPSGPPATSSGRELEPQLHTPVDLTSFEISDEDYTDDDDGYDSADFGSSDEDDSDQEGTSPSHSDIYPTEGDIEGIEIGDGDEIYITQPAFDDVEEGFFPSEEDAPEEHLDSHTLGHVHASSGIRRWNHRGVVHEIDWALMKLKDERLQPFNLVQGGQRYRSDQQSASCPRLRDPVNRRNFTPEEDEYPRHVATATELGSLQVHCFGRTSGLKGGVIGATMSAVRIYQRRTFSRSWHVGGGGFGEGGDSGAWVIDNETGQVCGHVLAWCGRNKLAYICPMEILLEDMRRALGVEKISLPGAEEVTSAAMGDTERLTRALPGNDAFNLPDLRNMHINDRGRIPFQPRLVRNDPPNRIDRSIGAQRQLA